MNCIEYKHKTETRSNLKSGKRKIYPKSSKSFRIIHPHFDNFDDHILTFLGWYIDKTPKGHATIGMCNLNRRTDELGYNQELLYNIRMVERFVSVVEESDPGVRKRLVENILKSI